MAEENNAPVGEQSQELNVEGLEQELQDQENGEQEIQQAQTKPTAEQKKAAEKLEKEFKIKVNGKEMSTKIDLNDEARIVKALQLEAAAQQAFQEKAITAKQLGEMQNMVQEFLQQFTEDPLSVIMDPEMKLTKEQKRKLAEAILKEDLEESKKTPEQLKLEEAEKKYQQLLEEKKQLEEAKQKEEQSRLEAEAASMLEKEVTDAIEKSELPKVPYFNKVLTDLAYIAYSNGIDVSIAEIAPLVKNTFKSDFKELAGILSDEEMEEIISSERIRRIRNKQIQSVKPKENAPKAPLKTQDTGASNVKKEETRKVRASDFFSKLGG